MKKSNASGTGAADANAADTGGGQQYGRLEQCAGKRFGHGCTESADCGASAQGADVFTPGTGICEITASSGVCVTGGNVYGNIPI
mgnify:CR=1 FL=1